MIILFFSLEREVSFNWIFILIAAIIIVFFVILCGLCVFCLIQNRKRRRNLRMYPKKQTTIFR